MWSFDLFLFKKITLGKLIAKIKKSSKYIGFEQFVCHWGRGYTQAIILFPSGYLKWSNNPNKIPSFNLKPVKIGELTQSILDLYNPYLSKNK